MSKGEKPIKDASHELNQIEEINLGKTTYIDLVNYSETKRKK